MKLLLTYFVLSGVINCGYSEPQAWQSLFKLPSEETATAQDAKGASHEIGICTLDKEIVTEIQRDADWKRADVAAVDMSMGFRPYENPDWVTPDAAVEVTLEGIQNGLDVVGMVPVPFVAEGADLVNAGIYALNREWVDSALSMGALVPAVGSTVTIGRITGRVGDTINGENGKLTQLFSPDGKEMWISSDVVSQKDVLAAMERSPNDKFDVFTGVHGYSTGKTFPESYFLESDRELFELLLPDADITLYDFNKLSPEKAKDLLTRGRTTTITGFCHGAECLEDLLKGSK